MKRRMHAPSSTVQQASSLLQSRNDNPVMIMMGVEWSRGNTLEGQSRGSGSNLGRDKNCLKIRDEQ